MSRKPTIKWRASDAEKLKKEVERFNDKIYRARHNHPELADILPDTIKKADKEKIIEELKSQPRSQFNKTINSLDRFTKRGAEKEIISDTGNRVTKWEKNEVAIKVAQINRERTKERKMAENMEVTSRGNPVGLKRGEMGSERLNELKPKKFDFNKIKAGREWELYKASLEKQSNVNYQSEKYKRYKMNYIKAMSKVMGEYGEYTVRQLKQLPAEYVVELYYKEQEATIDFVYDPQELIAKLDIIEEIWQKAYDENPNIISNENWSVEEESILNEWIEKGC